MKFIKRFDKKVNERYHVGIVGYIKFDNDPIKMDPYIARAGEDFAKKDVRNYQDLDIFIKFT